MQCYTGVVQLAHHLRRKAANVSSLGEVLVEAQIQHQLVHDATAVCQSPFLVYRLHGTQGVPGQ